MEIGRTSGVFDERNINTIFDKLRKAEGTHRSPPLFCYAVVSATLSNLYPIPHTFFMYSAFEVVSFLRSDLR